MAEAFVYEHIWPIVDDSLPLSALAVEASRQLGLILGRKGVRPTARPRFRVYEDVLRCEVPVLRVAGDVPDDDVDETAVGALIRAGVPDGHIAARLGVPRSEVERIRGEMEHEPAGEPAAVGVG